MPPHEFREMQEETRGSFGGIGIRIGVEDGQVVIVEPMEGTPASKAGLKQGDRIMKIDGQPTQGLPLAGSCPPYARAGGKPRGAEHRAPRWRRARGCLS